MKTHKHFPSFSFTSAQKRLAYFAMEEGPKPVEKKDATKEAPSGKPDLANKEVRDKLYVDTQAKIDELKAKGDKGSVARAEGLERALKFCQDDEKDHLEAPEASAERLSARLDRALKASPIVEAPKVQVAAAKVEGGKEVAVKAVKLPPGLPKDVADSVIQQLDAKGTGQYDSGNARVTFKYEGKDYVAVKFFGPAVKEPGHVRYEITLGSANA